MAVGIATLSATQAGAQQAKTQNNAVKVAPAAKPVTTPAAKPVANPAPRPAGAVDVAVDDGAKGTRMYRYDRGSGKLTLVKQLSQKEAASTTAGFKALTSVEKAGGLSLVDPDRGGAVSPEGPRPKGGGGPPGGHDPGLITQADLANINRELSAMRLDKAQVKIAMPQQP
ncbi:hypothetical protein D7W79_29755 [Corallococcus exercitus]|uniref:hypothetical protein n=1 Tax=Corallococcus exercitus TaxID=2316736 RepID=UPI000EA409EA|nr:hypothetical protein [Corallococcus exercitus]RKG72038.1 hypothetical protein D7W79_29755 [Corallococcus exercitus]